MLYTCFSKYKINYLLILLLSISFLLLFANTLLGLTFDFKDLVEVRGEKLTVGDLANISPEHKAKEFKDKCLFHAPDPGQTRQYKAQTLMAYVQEAVHEAEKLQWTGADVVTVRQKGQLISKKRIYKIIDNYIQEQLSQVPESQIKFEVQSMPEPFTLPHGQISYEVVPSSPNMIDSRQFSIIFRMHGDVVKNIRVRGQIHAFDKVAVARYQLRRDQVIEEDDIKMVSKDITSCTNPVLNKELVLGKEVKRGIYPGQVLEKRWLVRPNLVERGQTITMYISKGSLMISALGVACSDAKKDQVIKVKNIGSQKEVYCKVVSSNKALVEY